MNLFTDTKEDSYFNKNLENIRKGWEGEDIVRSFLKNTGIRFMQADLLFKHNDKWYLGEVKCQKKYVNWSTGFEGHGLPPWQVKHRIELYKDTGIIPYLFVVCQTDNVLYHESLLKLNETDYFSTTKTPRTIFNINEFKKSEIT
tara:strand:- start:1691 stop:2122 length:432 start_codon:yes stop_codon:yes gene_type:complete